MGKSKNAYDCLRFEVEDRFECGLTGKVKYKSRVEDYMPFSIPLEAAVNAAEVEAWKSKVAEAESRGEKLDQKDLVRPQIPFEGKLNPTFLLILSRYFKLVILVCIGKK